jgi:hypothetical protein
LNRNKDFSPHWNLFLMNVFDAELFFIKKTINFPVGDHWDLIPSNN